MGCALSAPPNDVKVEFPQPPKATEVVELEEAREAVRICAVNAKIEAERAAALELRLKLRAEDAAKRASRSALHAKRAQEELLKLKDPEFNPLDADSDSADEIDDSDKAISDDTSLKSSNRDVMKEAEVDHYTQTFEDNVIPRSASFQYYSPTRKDSSLSSFGHREFDHRKTPSVRDIARMFENLSTTETAGKEEKEQESRRSVSAKEERTRNDHKYDLAPTDDMELSLRLSDGESTTSTQPISVDIRENLSIHPAVSDYGHMFDFDVDNEPQERLRKLPSIRRHVAPTHGKTRRRNKLCFGAPEVNHRLTEGHFTPTARTPLSALQSDSIHID